MQTQAKNIRKRNFPNSQISVDTIAKLELIGKIILYVISQG